MTATATPETSVDDGHDEHTSTGISNIKLAMWVFLGSECLLFGGLISTYLLYKTKGDGKTVPTDVFDIPFTSISSFVLLMSSLTMVLALSAVGRGEPERGRVWLLTTAMLGGIFIGGQVYEFTSFLREGVGYTTNPASSAFFTLTGFHGIHVSVGILMLMSFVRRLGEGKPHQGERRDDRDRRVVLALRRHRVDLHLHGHLPGPGVSPRSTP